MLPDLKQLVRSPLLPRYHERIGAILAEEHLKRLQFYEAMQEGQKVEFINGEVIVHSPVKLEHSQASQYLLRLLQTFVDLRDLGYVGHEKLMVSLSRNDYEPDICFWSKAKTAAFTAVQMKFPAPDLIAEVLSPSTEQVDREIKFEDYAAHGVAEYWLIDPDAQTVEQYALGAQGDAYELLTKLRASGAAGVIASVAVAGFTVPVRAIFERDENLKALRALVGDVRLLKEV